MLTLALCLLFTSCASEQTVTKRKVDRDIWGGESSFSVGKDEQGNPQMQSDLRSAFEGATNNSLASSKQYSGREYTKKSYRKERWGGDSSYKTKSYTGSGEGHAYGKEPWFARKQALAGKEQAPEARQGFFTKLFGTKSARERSQESLRRDSDAETDVRRRVFKQPDVIGWKDQSALSVQDTNRMLGR